MAATEGHRDGTTQYRVVVNDEEQFSIWPAAKRIPAGWRDAGKQGLRTECLEHIRTVWTDMRPRSVRAAAEAARHVDAVSNADTESQPPPEDDLVVRLAARDHPVEPLLRPDRSARALKDRIDRGSVHLRFFGANGTTDLPIRFDPRAVDTRGADFGRQTGVVRFEGALTLNGVAVVCTAEIALDTLRGSGRLRVDDIRSSASR
ncbi:MAG: MbtH family protein [Vicinamibacterales bacterium]